MSLLAALFVWRFVPETKRVPDLRIVVPVQRTFAEVAERWRASRLDHAAETVKNTGREKLLTSILDPNREVAPQFTAYVVETTDAVVVIEVADRVEELVLDRRLVVLDDAPPPAIDGLRPHAFVPRAYRRPITTDERERFEHHPENAGTEYEVLFGLLGSNYRADLSFACTVDNRGRIRDVDINRR